MFCFFCEYIWLLLKPFEFSWVYWTERRVKMEIDVPTSVAYTCYSDRQAIPRWMPFISSVKVTALLPTPLIFTYHFIYIFLISVR